MWTKGSGDGSSQIMKKLSTTVGHSFSLKIKKKIPTISLMNYVKYLLRYMKMHGTNALHIS
jgi:hypothetical protein